MVEECEVSFIDRLMPNPDVPNLTPENLKPLLTQAGEWLVSTWRDLFESWLLILAFWVLGS